MTKFDLLVLIIIAAIVFGFFDPIFMHGAITATCQDILYTLLNDFFSAIATVLRIIADALISAFAPIVERFAPVVILMFGIWFLSKFIGGPMVDATKKAPPKPAGKKKAAPH